MDAGWSRRNNWGSLNGFLAKEEEKIMGGSEGGKGKWRQEQVNKREGSSGRKTDGRKKSMSGQKRKW